MAKKAAPKPGKSKPTPKPKQANKTPAVSLQILDRPAGFKGIERLVFVDVNTLSEHPDNWKTHTDRQLAALDSEIGTVGWVLPMVYNLATNRLLDGHGRKNTKIVKKHKIVPVVVGRWDEQEEAQILLHLDPIGGMFETNTKKFEQLMSRHRESLESLEDALDAHTAQVFDQINEDLETHVQAIDLGATNSFLPSSSIYKDASSFAEKTKSNEVGIDQVSSDLSGPFTLKTWEETPFDAYNPVGNYDIPFLRPDMLGDVPDELQTWVGPETPEASAYFYIYGSAAIEKVRSSSMIVSFYTYDEKFESIWNDPRKFTARMLNLSIQAVISVNFSVWHNSPKAFDIWQTYRSRWLGRYWQEAGLKVIPDVVMANPKNKQQVITTYETIPKNAPCIAIQLQQKGDAKPDVFYAQKRVRILHMLEQLSPKKLLVYHGPDLPDYVLAGVDIPIVKVKSWMIERGKILKQKDYLSNQ